MIDLIVAAGQFVVVVFVYIQTVVNLVVNLFFRGP
jgi:hypothetical protein